METVYVTAFVPSDVLGLLGSERLLVGTQGANQCSRRLQVLRGYRQWLNGRNSASLGT